MVDARELTQRIFPRHPHPYPCAWNCFISIYLTYLVSIARQRYPLTPTISNATIICMVPRLPKSTPTRAHMDRHTRTHDTHTHGYGIARAYACACAIPYLCELW